MAYYAAGTLLYRDLTTITTLGSASVGMATLQAKGVPPAQIQSFLQPIVIDLHQISNPWTNYNIYLSTVLVPGVIMLFIFLITGIFHWAQSLSSSAHASGFRWPTATSWWRLPARCCRRH